jgi:hypothetical protein
VADNILKGEIKITAPGLQQTVSEVTSAMDRMDKSFTASNGMVFKAGLSWLDFKHAVKDATKDATGNILSCGDAAKTASPFWKEYKDAGMNAVQSVGAAAGESVGKITSLGDALKPIATNAAETAGVISVLQNKLQLFQQALALEKNPGSFNTLKESITEIQRSIIGLGGAPNPFTSIIQNGTIAGKSIDDFRAQLERFEAALPQAKSVESFDRIGRAIDTVKVKMELLGKDAPASTALQPLESAFVNAVKSTRQLEAEIHALKGVLADSTDPAILDRFGKRIEQLQGQINNNKIFAFGGSADTVQLTKFTRGLEDVAKRSYTARYAVQDMGNFIRDIPFAAANPAILMASLEHVTSAFSNLKQEAGSTKGAMGLLVNSLKGGGGILIGFNLIAIAAGYLLGGLSKVDQKAQETTKHFMEFQPTMKEMTKGLSEAAAQLASKDFGQVSALKAVLTDLTIPLQKRNEALKEYNKIADAQNKITATDISNIDIINGKIGTQIELFKTRALVRAAEDKITELSKPIFDVKFKLSTAGPTAVQAPKVISKDAQSEYQSFVKTVQSGSQAMQVASAEALKGFTFFGTDITGKDGLILKRLFGDKGAQSTINSVSDASAQIENLQRFIQQMVKEGAGFGKIFDVSDTKTHTEKIKSQFDFFEKTFENSAQQILDKTKPLFEKIGDVDVLKNVNLKPAETRLIHDLGEMANAARNYASKNFEIFDGLDKVLLGKDNRSIVEAGKKFWTDFQAGIVKLKPPKIRIEQEIEFVPKVTDAPPINNDAALKHLQATLEMPQETQKDILDSYRNAFAKIGQELPKYINEIDEKTGGTKKVPLKVVLETDLTTGNLKEGLKQKLGEALQTIAEFKKDLNDSLKQIGSNIFAGFGEALGTALGGGDITKVFQSLGQTLGGIIQNLGLQMIALAPLIQGIEVAIKTLNPALLLPAGIGMVALGATIKGLFSSQKFAAGGFVPGSGNTDSVPALLMPGEFVIPKNKVSEWLSIIQGYGGQVKKYATGGLVSSMLGTEKYFSTTNSISSLALAPVQVNGSFELSGRNLVAVFSQELKHQGRNF